MFDYSQRPPTREWDKNYPKIFKHGVVNIPQIEDMDCGWEVYKNGLGRKGYKCYCKSNICKKDVKR